MRVMVVVVAALMTLGLAALGVVEARKATFPLPSFSLLTRGAPSAETANAPTQRVADLSGKIIPSHPDAAASMTTSPVRVAENTANPTLAAASANGPSATAPTAPSPVPAPASTNIPACDKPGGMGLARVVEIDTTGGPSFGFEHFKQYDFLRDKEVVLTFDDGPWPANTPAVLKALEDNCLKATFFEIGEHATWHPEITKQLIAAGETVGTHTWSHKDLARNPYASDLEKAKAEIEMGISAVHMAAAAPIAPFFRFPDLQHPPAMLSYLAERNIATFSTDIDSRDFKLHKPELFIKSVMSQLDKRGKGIVLMHDFQRNTAEAFPELLRQLKAGGYKIVHMVPHGMGTTLPQYDDMVMKQDKLSVTNTRPVSSVVRTIGE
jgi:peptidoglycan/xylan/chitin deacetylase (PgdA/CDA1 family)